MGASAREGDCVFLDYSREERVELERLLAVRTVEQLACITTSWRRGNPGDNILLGKQFLFTEENIDQFDF
ncbi:MAG TPA: hypothetical protein VNT99_07180 [Methylomirabilota bacterium]|nr:hypothetical protein [Methylomirabilota bacterium]